METYNQIYFQCQLWKESFRYVLSAVYAIWVYRVLCLCVLWMDSVVCQLNDFYAFVWWKTLRFGSEQFSFYLLIDLGVIEYKSIVWALHNIRIGGMASQLHWAKPMAASKKLSVLKIFARWICARWCVMLFIFESLKCLFEEEIVIILFVECNLDARLRSP